MKLRFLLSLLQVSLVAAFPHNRAAPDLGAVNAPKRLNARQVTINSNKTEAGCVTLSPSRTSSVHEATFEPFLNPSPALPSQGSGVVSSTISAVNATPQAQQQQQTHTTVLQQTASITLNQTSTILARNSSLSTVPLVPNAPAAGTTKAFSASETVNNAIPSPSTETVFSAIPDSSGAAASVSVASNTATYLNSMSSGLATSGNNATSTGTLPRLPMQLTFPQASSQSSLPSHPATEVGSGSVSSLSLGGILSSTFASLVNMDPPRAAVSTVCRGTVVSSISVPSSTNSGLLADSTSHVKLATSQNMSNDTQIIATRTFIATVNGQVTNWIENDAGSTHLPQPSAPSSSSNGTLASPTVATITSVFSSVASISGLFGNFTSNGTSLKTVQSQVSIPKGTTQTIVFTTELQTTLTVSEIQTVTVTLQPTEGVAHTSLQMTGQNTVIPFNTTSLARPSAAVSPINQGPEVISSNQVTWQTGNMSGNIFVPISTGAPPQQISARGNHPVPRQGIVNQGPPIQTNKFYANFFLGNRTQSTFTHPYSVAWVKGLGASGSYGISVSQVDRDRVVYGEGNPARYFVNPIGLQSLILSAQELGAGTVMTMDSLMAFSANINLARSAGATPMITFPVVQGMAFVTGVYNQGTPLIQTSIYFKGMTYAGIVSGTQIAKYVVSLNDNTRWLIYLRPNSGSTVPTLTLLNTGTIIGNRPFSGAIQVAKSPTGTSADSVYDSHVGVYPLRGTVAGAANQNIGSYSLSWIKGGNINKKLLMFALPHHIQSLQSGGTVTQLKLQTTTKGMATAVIGDSWTLVESNLPYDMGFAPWSPAMRSQTKLPQSAINMINQVAPMELAQNVTAQTYLDSMYFSGKALAKFATIVYTSNTLAHDRGTASAGLAKLKDALASFINNKQIHPLVFDSSWGGIVSSATYTTGDSNADFGNTYYNDHHFHYGYFVYTAAVIGFLDPTWLKQGTNVAWINTLLRDYANSATNDQYFPFSRMFDWYHGHSWAHGLYETADGKDEESSSEDAFSSYALKMWGRTVGDANMEARGNLMLSITARSLTNYYLMQSTNTVQPARFIGNKAAGILFENKIDHTTYFGTNTEYIEGIHMLPLNPSSTLTRNATFVREEWDMYFSNGRADAVQGGWKGILYANLAIIDPRTAYNFFASPNFQAAWLDGGASRTWYLAFAAGLGGAQ